MSLRNGNWIGVMAFMVFVALIVALVTFVDITPDRVEDPSYRHIHPSIVAVPDTVTGATCYVWTGGTTFISCVQ